MTRHSIQLKAILFDLDGTLINSAECDILIMKRIIQEDLGFEPDPEDLKRYNAMSSSSVMKSMRLILRKCGIGYVSFPESNRCSAALNIRALSWL
jgi:beta-phosphoglucomutase-like phosphatase (HAD superfamily)